MAHREPSAAKILLDRVGKPQQTEGVCDRASILADPLAELLLRPAEVCEELPIALRRFDRVQILTQQVLDQSGRVLGIVSFGITDDKGRQLTGQGYFVPVSVIAQTLKKAQVRPAPGSLTATYYKALAAGDIHYYKPELAYLEQIQSRATFDAYVKDDLIAVEGSLLSGADQTPADLRPYLPAGVGAAFAALLLAVAAWVGLRLRTRQRTAGGASPALRPA